MLVAQSTPHEVIARAGLRTEALGCWVLYDSAGRRAQGSLYWAPAIAQLKSTRDSSRWKFSPMSRDALRIDSLGRDLSAIDDPRKRGWGFWSADSLSDSIRIGFSSGFSGT
ncbi:MAG TPA: hypothetical protein VLN59_05765, partial [Burkholderiales bacterium]|nr:hypothetical protein [Burkholderiales bacterium]